MSIELYTYNLTVTGSDDLDPPFSVMGDLDYLEEKKL